MSITPSSTTFPFSRTGPSLGVYGSVGFHALATMVDLGFGGVGLRTRSCLQLDHTYRVQIGNTDIALPARAVWQKLDGTREDTDGRQYPVYRCGLRFEDHAAATRRTDLERFLASAAEVPTGTPRPTPRFQLRLRTKNLLQGRYPFLVVQLTPAGMVVETARVPDLDRALTLHLRLAKQTHDLTARVRDVVQVARDGGLQTLVALEFVDLAAPEQRAVEEFLDLKAAAGR